MHVLFNDESAFVFNKVAPYIGKILYHKLNLYIMDLENYGKFNQTLFQTLVFVVGPTMYASDPKTFIQPCNKTTEQCLYLHLN